MTFKKNAKSERRSIVNFIEHATLVYLNSEMDIPDEEMNDKLKNKTLMENLRNGLKDIEKRNYKIID